MLLANVVPIGGAGFLLGAGTNSGKGYQVAPVLAAMVGVLFGISTVSIVFRNVRSVWYEAHSAGVGGSMPRATADSGK